MATRIGYSKKSDTVIGWQEANRMITMGFDCQLRNFRDRALNEIRSVASEKYLAALNNDQVAELDARISQAIREALEAALTPVQEKISGLLEN